MLQQLRSQQCHKPSSCGIFFFSFFSPSFPYSPDSFFLLISPFLYHVIVFFFHRGVSMKMKTIIITFYYSLLNFYLFASGFVAWNGRHLLLSFFVCFSSYFLQNYPNFFYFWFFFFSFFKKNKSMGKIKKLLEENLPGIYVYRYVCFFPAPSFSLTSSFLYLLIPHINAVLKLEKILKTTHLIHISWYTHPPPPPPSPSNFPPFPRVSTFFAFCFSLPL